MNDRGAFPNGQQNRHINRVGPDIPQQRALRVLAVLCARVARKKAEASRERRFHFNICWSLVLILNALTQIPC